MRYKQTASQYVKYLIRRKGLTYNALGMYIGYSHEIIKKICIGDRRISTRLACALAGALGVNPREILYRQASEEIDKHIAKVGKVPKYQDIFSW